ncbi:MAG TPA: BON domain-containing protein [Firmicutes bacterium]|nr:BON domain-containing protein [Bacillota bacterium]
MARDLETSLYEDEKAKLILSRSEPAEMKKHGFWAGVVMLPIILLVVLIIYSVYVTAVVSIGKMNPDLATGVTAEGEKVAIDSFATYFSSLTDNWGTLLLAIIPAMLITGVLGIFYSHFHAKALRRDKPLSLYFSWAVFLVIFLIIGFLKIPLAWYFNIFLAVFLAGVIGYTVLAFWKAMYTKYMFKNSQGPLMDIFYALEMAMDTDPNLRRVYIIDWDGEKGKVTVGGAVDNLKRKEKVDEIMNSVEGVKEIENRCRHRYE